MFFAVSIIFLLCIYVSRRRFSIWLRIPLVGFIIVVFGFFLWVLEVPIRSDGKPWFDTSPYKQLIALALMLGGMVAKYLFDLIQERRKKKEQGEPNPRLEFDKWNFLRPFIVSFIVFGSFWQLHGNESLSLGWLVISFQNGFFWQTILEK